MAIHLAISKFYDLLFCRSAVLWCFSLGDGFSTNAITSYIGYSRALNSQVSLLCDNKDDFFTVENNAGNKALTYPIGLIASDELMYAGINYRKAINILMFHLIFYTGLWVLHNFIKIMV